MVEFDEGQFIGAIMITSVFGLTCICYTVWFVDICCCRRRNHFTNVIPISTES